METTLNHAKTVLGYADYNDLLNLLGKSDPDDNPLSILTILKLQPIDYLEATNLKIVLQLMEGMDLSKYRRILRLYAVWCAMRVNQISGEDYPLKCAIDIANESGYPFSKGRYGETYHIGLRRGGFNGVFYYEESLDAAYATLFCDPHSAVFQTIFCVNEIFKFVDIFPELRDKLNISKGHDEEVVQADELIRVLDCVENNKDPYPLWR